MSGIKNTNKLGRVTKGFKKYLIESGKIAYEFSFSNSSNSSIAYLVERGTTGIFQYSVFSIEIEFVMNAGLFNGDAGTNPATLFIQANGNELIKKTASSATENLSIYNFSRKLTLSNSDLRIQSTGFSGATDRLSGSGIIIFNEGDITNIRENYLNNQVVKRFEP